MPDELTILSHPARVQRARPDAMDALREVLSERYALPGDSDVFFFRAEISNDNLDSHFTHMAESTLRNYAADAKTGVAFLAGHDWRSLPIGYSLDAAFEQDGRKRVVADFYTVAGLKETDDLIQRMKTGLLRDVSVGFYGGHMTCDLCARDYWDCPHIPGLRYEVKDEDAVRNQLATFTIEEARLSEVSGVFDGSTPGAMILKAQERAAELTDMQRRILEQRYRISLPAGKRAFAGVDIGNRGQQPGKDEEMNEEIVGKLRGLLGVASDEELVRQVETLQGSLADAQKRVKELEPQAADGRQYRTDLINETLAEGVRAYGQDFDEPTYRSMLEHAPLANIKRMRDDWRKIGDERLPAGRRSVDEDQTKNKPVLRVVPDAAFAA